MSIIERTELLKLTQYSGSSLMAQFVLNYNEDMRKIDGHFSDYEDAINQRVSDLQSDVAQFETDMTTAFANTEAVVTAMDGRVATLEQCCSDVNTTLLNYGSRLVEIERVIDTVSTANIDDLTERVNALENKVETNTTNIGILRNDLHEIEERVTVAESTLVEHGTQLANHENRIANIERCCDEVHGELTRIEGKVDSNKSEIDALKQRVTVNEGNIAANAQDITILSGQVAVNTADIEDLKQGLAELDPTSQLEVVRQVSINTENITNMQASIAAQATSLTNVTTRVSNVEDDIVDLKADNVSLHNEIAQVQGWDSRISAAEATAQQASSDVTQIQLSVSQLSASLIGVDGRLTQAESDIDAIEAKNLVYDSKIATDEAALAALTDRVAANESDLTNIHQTITNDEAGLSALGTRVSALETQCGSDTLNTTAQTLSGGVNEVNTLVVNADSKATQALSLANTASADASDAKSDAANAVADVANLSTVVGDSSSGLVKDVADIQSELVDFVKGFTASAYNAVTGLAYDSTTKRLGLKVGADTVIPFSSVNYSLANPLRIEPTYNVQSYTAPAGTKAAIAVTCGLYTGHSPEKIWLNNVEVPTTWYKQNDYNQDAMTQLWFVPECKQGDVIRFLNYGGYPSWENHTVIWLS